jgi:hypothetical protein
VWEEISLAPRPASPWLSPSSPVPRVSLLELAGGREFKKHSFFFIRFLFIFISQASIALHITCAQCTPFHHFPMRANGGQRPGPWPPPLDSSVFAVT